MAEGTVEQVLAGEAAWCVLHGDVRDLLPTLPADFFDACVCDPPYELGFMARKWDRSGVATDPEVWAGVLHALKPGAHLCAFGGTRTYHRIACAIEDGGFELRDSILAFLHGQGFPKSLDLAKEADKRLGHWRGRRGDEVSGNAAMSGGNFERTDKGEPVTAAAAALQGLGSALKPSFEPIAFARKPLDGTLLTNVQKWGTGALRIDDCRVAHAGVSDLEAHAAGVAAIKARGGSMDGSWKNSSDLSGANDVSTEGRWPPNAVFQHHPSCRRTGTVDVPANPTWDTPSRATEPSAFTGSEVSKVRHANGRNGEPSADKRYTDQGATSFAPLPGARRDATETVVQWECVEGCPVRELSTQSGASVSRNGGTSGSNANPMSWTQENRDRPRVAPDDAGSAARYFPQFQHDPELDDLTPFLYQAKPCRSETEAGLEHFRPRSGAEATDSEEGQKRLDSPRSGAGRGGGVRNVHPTKKGVELIRWIARLVTPRKGIVLVPFSGAGSEMIACLLEGCRVVGIELNDTNEEPYVSLARARLHHIEGRTFVPRESLRAAEPPRQRGLWETGT
jgi:hypothetical protein